jgi:hypothetical protein
MDDWSEGITAVVTTQDAGGGVYLKGHGRRFYNPTQLKRVV